MSSLAHRLRAAALAALVLAWYVPPADAATLTQKDVLILGRVFAFLDPPVATDGVAAIVFVGGDDASRKDAEAIAAYFGDGLKAGANTIKAKLVEVGKLGDASGYVAIIAAQGAAGDVVMAAAKGRKMLCASGELEQVQAGKCILAIRTDPKVEITLNRSAASTANIGFAAAFRMMIHEF